jgi:predicted polyphosphate/ATP-dependent NAD kinase
VVAQDADETTLLALADERPLIVLTPVGGQGFLLGRGNQQLSPLVLARTGLEALCIVATERKLAALGGAPLCVDTGDEAMDARLAGYRRVITGHGREAVYPVVA